MFEMQRGWIRDVYELQRSRKEIYDEVCPQLRLGFVFIYRDDNLQALQWHRLIPLYAVRGNGRTIEE